ncbi:MAG: PQQ-binding-like beta-propeller repeat protein [Anaerolineae bacterium]|nr:PQQ-binding-like beta-propeller repeat protein [Anaerolineae bacterium]
MASNLDTRRITENEPAAARRDGTLPAKTILQERYEILAVQGIGGMGAVYQARDLRFGAVSRIIAVKEMMNNAPDPRLRQISVQNFEREANILASLSHPAIPKIFDFFSESDRSYLVLEFVDGRTLEEVLSERRKPFEQEGVLDWALQVCDVLTYLHSQKPPVIFRDMKPDNLMLRHDGRLMVIDFGIAKVFEQGQRGTMIGTEGYSPPEQYRGVADPRGDLYALSATLHHLLTNRDPRLEPPFSFHERPIQLFNPSVVPEFQAVINRALAYDLDDRYSSAAEMAQALSKALPGRRAAMPGLGGLATNAAPQDVVPKWTFRCEDEVRSSPRVADGVLYIGSYDHNLYALDAERGAFIWKFPTQSGIASTPAIYQTQALVGSDDGHLYAVSCRTGHEIWACAVGGPIRSSPRLEYGHAFVGSDDGHLYAVNAQSGRIVWRFQTAGPIRSSPLISGEMIYVGSDDGFVYAVEMRNGQVKWKYNTNRRVTSSPAIHDVLILVGSADGSLHSINAGSGWPMWRFRTKGAILSSPVVIDDNVCFGSADGYLYCLDAKTGRQVWRYEAGSPIASSPAASDGVLYVGSNDGAIHAVEAANGRSRWRYVTGGPVPSSPIVVSNTVYVGSNDHNVYALPT